MRQICSFVRWGRSRLLSWLLPAAGCGSSAPGLEEGVDGAFIRAAATWDLDRDGDVTCDE